MLLLLGASGCIGAAFARELLRRGQAFIPLSRKAIDYTDFNLLFEYIRRTRPDFVINAAGFSGPIEESAVESIRSQVLGANTLLPQTIARACLMTNTPWGHVSSGSIYRGAKIAEESGLRVEPDLHDPAVLRLAEEHPERLLGFLEADPPNFTFRSTPCSFYSGTKALGEEAIRDVGPSFIWRPGLIFSDQEHPRNLLFHLMHTDRHCDSVNSLSHVDEFARACLDLWEQHAPFGTYHVVNPGPVTIRQLVRSIERILKVGHTFEFGNGHGESGGSDRNTHAHALLDASKLRHSGIVLRPVHTAVEDALSHWQPERRIIELQPV